MTSEPAATRTSPDGDSVEVLEPDECWRLLAEERFGRLAVQFAGEIDLYPIDFVVDGRELVFRTAEGTKLVEVVLAGAVSIEADRRDVGTGIAWSVVVKGHAHLLENFDDIYRAQGLGIVTWTSSVKERFVRIRPKAITGRRFTAG